MAGKYLWHVVANIDTEYDSVQECMDAFRAGEGRFRPFLPYVPTTRMPDEDAVTCRLPVCAKLEECFSAIGLLGRFRRCLAANEDAFSYVEAGGEVYPILWDDENGRICKSAKFVREEDLKDKVHPWLTGTGNILESSLMDYAWEESPYRKPWADDEAKNVEEAFFVDKMPVRVIQCRIVPYRSTWEIIKLLSDRSADIA